MLWSIIGRKLVPLNVKNEAELFAEVERIWDELDQGMIDRLVKDFWRRCQLVKMVRGKTISQLLSSHILTPRPQDIGTALGESFTPELDELLLATVARARRTSWVKISQLDEFVGHKPKLLKQRWQLLTYQARNEEWQLIREEYPFGELLQETDVIDGSSPDDEPDYRHEDDPRQDDDSDDEDGDGDYEPVRARHVRRISSDDDDDVAVPAATRPPATPSRGPSTAYLLFAKETGAAPDIARMEGRAKAREISRRWHAAPPQEREAWESRAAETTKRGRGRPRKSAK
jgi:hypothetical protein